MIHALGRPSAGLRAEPDRSGFPPHWELRTRPHPSQQAARSYLRRSSLGAVHARLPAPGPTRFPLTPTSKQHRVPTPRPMLRHMTADPQPRVGFRASPAWVSRVHLPVGTRYPDPKGEEPTPKQHPPLPGVPGISLWTPTASPSPGSTSRIRLRIPSRALPLSRGPVVRPISRLLLLCQR